MTARSTPPTSALSAAPSSPARLSSEAEWSPLLATLKKLIDRAERVSGLELPPLTSDMRELNAGLTAQTAHLVERLDALLNVIGPVGPRAELRSLEGRPSDTRDGGRFSILVVDDDPIQRDALRQLLDPYFTTFAAADGAEGARLVREYLPDIVISDLCMPNADGFALLSTVRLGEETAHIPLLVISGLTETESKVRAFEAGAFDYITKPVVADELVARVRNALARAQTLRRERLLQSTDDLTGLANRRWLRTYLAGALRTAARTSSELCVVMVDQDRLKQINDRWGHAAGDSAIRAMGRALARCKRAGDCVARLGGDEFVVAMPGADRIGAQAFVTRVQHELRREPIAVDAQTRVHVSASFGVASARDVPEQESCDEILKRADQALYEAKRSRPPPS